MATAVAISESPKMATTLKQVGQRRDYQMIDPRLIEVEPSFNPRNYDLPENSAHLDELKISIGEIGLIQPLIVRLNKETGRAILLDGECRLRAILELIAEGHPVLSDADVPCFPAPAGSNDEATRLLTAITANTGKPLSKWELGAAFQKLYNLGLSPEKIMARTGYSKAFIAQSMELADAPDEVKKLLSSQAVTPSLALAELRANGSAAVQNLQARAHAAHSSGQKTAKREKSNPAPKASPKPAEAPNAKLAKTILDLFSDVPVEDLNDKKMDLVYVNRVKLLKLASFAVTADELKAQMDKVGAVQTIEAQF